MWVSSVWKWFYITWYGEKDAIDFVFLKIEVHGLVKSSIDFLGFYKVTRSKVKVTEAVYKQMVGKVLCLQMKSFEPSVGPSPNLAKDCL